MRSAPADLPFRARYWTVAPDHYTSATRDTFPEDERLKEARPYDVGIAFSGGGTRSAGAALGQLRALDCQGWLSRVRYVSAVSGGAWSLVPYTYYRGPIHQLIGRYVPPGALTRADVMQRPDGALAKAIAESSLGGAGLREAAREAIDPLFSKALGGQISLLRKLPFMGSAGRDRTFSRLLEQVFTKKLVPDTIGRAVAWDDESVNEILEENRTLHRDDLRFSDFVTASPSSRPFLIVGGSLVTSRPDFDMPRIVPVEYTGLYTGVRQQFGTALGGTYVRTAFYDSATARNVGANILEVGRLAGTAAPGLSDLMASTGAAPQLWLLMAPGLPENVGRAITRGGEFFPFFHSVSVPIGANDPAYVAIERSAHGDGGFTDNLGVMPLLARQVKNIIVFVNSNTAVDRNNGLASLFRPAGQDATGDRTKNEVFPERRHRELLAGLETPIRNGEAAVYCGTNWEVRVNEWYNISAYTGLNICWVYNHAASAWEGELPADVRSLLDETGSTKGMPNFERFPWFRTFGENAPHLIELKLPQVNLLASIAGWSIANQRSVDTIRGVLGDVLDAPPSSCQAVAPASGGASRPASR